jgi:hypothetical protein
MIMDKSSDRLARSAYELWRYRASDIDAFNGEVVIKLTASGCGGREGLWGNF